MGRHSTIDYKLVAKHHSNIATIWQCSYKPAFLGTLRTMFWSLCSLYELD